MYTYKTIFTNLILIKLFQMKYHLYIFWHQLIIFGGFKINIMNGKVNVLEIASDSVLTCEYQFSKGLSYVLNHDQYKL